MTKKPALLSLNCCVSDLELRKLHLLQHSVKESVTVHVFRHWLMGNYAWIPCYELWGFFHSCFSQSDPVNTENDPLWEYLSTHPVFGISDHCTGLETHRRERGGGWGAQLQSWEEAVRIASIPDPHMISDNIYSKKGRPGTCFFVGEWQYLPQGRGLAWLSPCRNHFSASATFPSTDWGQ